MEKPTIMWKTYRGTTPKGKPFAHIAPVVFEKLMDKHILTSGCPCGPKVDRDSFAITLIIHEVIH